MEKKKKIILIIIISLLVVSVLGLGGYIVYDKVLNSNVGKTTTAEKQYVFKKQNVNTLNNCFSSLDDDKSGDCTKPIEINGEEHILKLSISFSTTTGPQPILYIDNKKIIEFDVATFDGLDEVYIIDDTIAVNDPGVFFDTVYLYTFENKKITKIDRLDSDSYYMQYYASFFENRIIFHRSIMSPLDASILKDENDGEGVYICDDEEMSKHGYDENTIVEWIYEMEYLGNNKFSKAIKLKEIKLSETNLHAGCKY